MMNQRNVLCVCEVNVLNRLIRRLLQDIDLETDSCGSISEAMQMLGAGEYDLVITHDLFGTRMNGMDLLVYIREAHPSTKVMIMSPRTKGAFYDQLIQLGADGYVALPINREALYARVQTVLSDRQGHPQ